MLLSAAFDLESLEWARCQTAKAQHQAWAAALPAGISPPRLHGAPLRLSPALDQALQQRGLQLGRWLQQRALQAPWPNLNVVCADLLLCDGEGDGAPWSLGWVEFQAFTSVAASVAWLHALSMPLWPALEALDPHGAALAPTAWREAYAGWVRGGRAGAVAVLEHQPWQANTAWDFAALQQQFAWPVVEPEHLVRCESHWELAGEPVGAVLNRVVEPHYPLAGSAQWQQLRKAATLHWHSPPELYAQVHKGLLVDWHAEAPGQGIQAARLRDWRSLALPAEALVLKPVLGLAGAGVCLRVDAHQLDTLVAGPAPEQWLVQRRLQALPFLRPEHSPPLQIELRLMLDCSAGQPVRLVSRMGRVSRLGGLASATTLAGSAGEGLALLLT